MLKLIHSFQYLNLERFSKFNIKNEYIINENNHKLIGLHDIPTDNTLYKLGINKLLIKKKSIKNRNICDTFKIKDEINICIYVDIIYKKLIEYVFSGKRIPEQKLFFKLLINNMNINTNVRFEPINIIKLNEQNTIKAIFFNNDIIKFGEIYVDVKLERFYLTKRELIDNNNLIMGNIIISNPCGNIRTPIINNTNKICVITYDYNNIKWTKNNKNYILINKNNFNTISNKQITLANIIIIDHSLLFNKKYINEWTLNNDGIAYDNYNTLKIYFNRNNNIESSLLFHLFYYDILILDSCLIPNNMIQLFSFKYIYYLTDEYNTSIVDLQNITNMLFNIKLNRLNYEYIKEGIYHEQIEINNNMKIVNANIKIDSINELSENIKLKDIVLFNSFELNLSPYRINIDKQTCNVDCSICLDTDIDNIGSLNNCNHKFCINCLDKLEKKICPLCREKFDIIYKTYPSLKHLSNRLNYIANIKNGLIISKYQKSIEKLSEFYTDLNIVNNIVERKTKVIKNSNYLMTYNNYNILNNFKISFKKIYLLEHLNDSDIYFKNILQSINAKNIIIINN